MNRFVQLTQRFAQKPQYSLGQFAQWLKQNKLSAGGALFALSVTASAAPQNLGFETGDLTGWSSTLVPGGVSVVSGTVTHYDYYGSPTNYAPPEGTYMAKLDNGHTKTISLYGDGNTGTIDSLEEFFFGDGATSTLLSSALAADFYSAVGTMTDGITPFTGAGVGIKQTFALSGGEIPYSFAEYLRYANGDVAPDDKVAVVILRPSGPNTVAVYDSVDAMATAWSSASHTFTIAGTYTFGVALIDGGYINDETYFVTSNLFLDQITVPTPGTFVLFATGLAGLVWLRRKEWTTTLQFAGPQLVTAF